VARRHGDAMKCPRCDDARWVCEAHEDRPWEGADSPRACKCGGAGMPCGLCNRGDEPELEPGFQVTAAARHGPQR